MSDRVPPHYIALITDAALKAYWFRNSFRLFLRGSGVDEPMLSTWAGDESKRDFFVRLMGRLQSSDSGIGTINAMADALLDQTSYPDLQQIEDSSVRISAAKKAQAELRAYREKNRKAAESARTEAESRKRFAEQQAVIARGRETLEKLDARLNELAQRLGTQQAGYDFQAWFYDLAEYSEISCRRPYTANGRQIDGSVTVDGTTYLIELKFQKPQCDAPAIDGLKAKVRSKADNTMGIMVAMSGFSSTAIRDASEAQTPLLLLDHGHLYMVLHSGVKLDDIIRRVRRHASQTGRAYLAPNEFGG